MIRKFNSSQLGVMQGRLCAPVDGQIQAFPILQWRDEFSTANSLKLNLIEWTLDHVGLKNNPFMTLAGREEIRKLCNVYRINITSVTGDCFMQAPFWKSSNHKKRAELLDEFDTVIHAAAELKIRHIIVPVVDGGRIETSDQARILKEEMLARHELLAQFGLSVAFESDFTPERLAEWISQYPDDCYGINYDTGNSASLGYCPLKEWKTYGARVINVHIKDRLLGGNTVPLGNGACNFSECLDAIMSVGYTKNLILQTARDPNGDHVGAIKRYCEFLHRLNWF